MLRPPILGIFVLEIIYFNFLHIAFFFFFLNVPKLIGQNTIRHAAAVKSCQSCPTLCDPIDGSLPGCAIPGILQARTLEWVAIAFSNA